MRSPTVPRYPLKKAPQESTWISEIHQVKWVIFVRRSSLFAASPLAILIDCECNAALLSPVQNPKNPFTIGDPLGEFKQFVTIDAQHNSTDENESPSNGQVHTDFNLGLIGD